MKVNKTTSQPINQKYTTKNNKRMQQNQTTNQNNKSSRIRNAIKNHKNKQFHPVTYTAIQMLQRI